MHLPPTSPFAVLVVCTGNICRSALAERLGRAYLDEALGADAEDVRMASAGTRAVVGSAMHPDSALVLEGLGGRPDGFRARQLTAGLVDAADLVLAMTHRHREVVLGLSPRALARTFLLREAGDLAGEVARIDAAEDEDLPARARAFVRAMARARGRRPTDASDDVPDPIGRPLEVHDQVGAAIAGPLLSLLDRVAALRPTADTRDTHAAPGGCGSV